MNDRDYLLLDVFTDRLFGGNALAVFTEADGMSAAQMQSIARELNLSETAYVLSAGGEAADFRLRIFTPGMELPFAGHPTIGAAIALASAGRIVVGDAADVLLIEEAGAVPVRIVQSEGRFTATLTSPRAPAPLPSELTPSLAAEVVGLAERDLGPFAPSAYSAGVPFLFVPLASADALARVTLDLPAWRAQVADTLAPHVVALTMEDWASGHEVRMRMFAPLMGIAEDPATGAAAAALAGLLVDRQAPGDGVHRWVVHQGYEMGRPSRIELEADVRGGRATAVHVGGGALVVGRGTIRVA